MRKMGQVGILLFLVLLHAPPTHAQTSIFDQLPDCDFDQYATSNDLVIGAVVLNWEMGAGCVENLDTIFPVASVSKLFIAGALYTQVALGQLSFDTELTFTSEYLMGGGTACLTAANVGQRYTLGELGNVMISCSDNSATWMLMDYLGWGTVSEYTRNLNIPDIGPILPYSAVDRLKLSLIDPRWNNVPPSLASQYLRSRIVTGLVPTYFDTPPDYSREQIRQANALYLDQYAYNTATPRAIAEYMSRLRNDQLGTDPIRQQVAQWVFNTMLLTQRVYSTQSFPGIVYVGSKNGFDVGYRAEVSITLRNLETYVPDTVSFVIVKHADVTLAPSGQRNTPITEFLEMISPRLIDILYPRLGQNNAPVPVQDNRVTRVVMNTRDTLFPCYEEFLNTGNTLALETCWAGVENVETLRGVQWVGMGMILRGLNQRDARVTVIYSLPNGRIRSYQMERFFATDTALGWWEEVDVRGRWRMDVFFNLLPIFSSWFQVQ